MPKSSAPHTLTPSPAQIAQPTPMLGGLSPQQFMAKHWQKKPLLIRQAFPGFVPPVGFDEVLALAAEEHAQARCITQRAGRFSLTEAPFATPLPKRTAKNWTVLLQGLEGMSPAANALLQAFRFVPDARLDDVMASVAGDGGGVGPHFDSYDVFLLQAAGTRRWRFGKQKDLSLQTGLPLKILRHFEPTQSFDLHAGDMLYLPPQWAHDGVALGQGCMTYSIGFRAPAQGELTRELLLRMADELAQAPKAAQLYADPAQAATDEPARLPMAMLEFATKSIAALALSTGISDDFMLRNLGEILTEPKPSSWFEGPAKDQWRRALSHGVSLPALSRMLYSDQHLFLNGESWRAAGSDAKLMRQLANARTLSAVQVAKSSEAAQNLLRDWYDDGWLHVQ